MHSQVYLAICVAACCIALWIGQPDLGVMILAASLAIAVLGVPHGGLDHWVGRRLLESRLPRSWWVAFFPAYLFIGLGFAAGWYWFPSATVVVFFVVSAWHFGREDNYASEGSYSFMPAFRFVAHLVATAVGGIVIWIPAITRSDELQSLLSLITPAADLGVVTKIVFLTQAIAFALLPIAGLQVLRGLIESPRDFTRWVPVATAIASAVLPILISFTIFFCGWHSWQGLRRLRTEEGLSGFQFALHITPLSMAAVVGVASIGWWLQRASGFENFDKSILQMAFIGLSAIAVPHLILHEIYAFSDRSSARLEPHS